MGKTSQQRWPANVDQVQKKSPCLTTVAPGECYNSSDQKDIFFINYLWIPRRYCLKGERRYFNINRHTKICGEHFVWPDDFVNPCATKLGLEDDAVPSIFAWTKKTFQSSKRSSVLEKLEARRIEKEEATDTASEGEGDMVDANSSGKELISRKTQTFEDDICSKLDDYSRIPCLHSFSVSHQLSKCITLRKEEKLFTHFTGFNSHGEFLNTLQFVLPNLDRKILIYWDTATRKNSIIDTETMFGGDIAEPDDSNDDDEDKNGTTLTRPTAHKLSVEDECLLVLMKLRMGLSVIDLAERFSVSESTVNNIFLTWINYLYVTLGSLKIRPHRDIILQNSPGEFLEKYPDNIIIIDATELKIQVPSALQKHSESSAHTSPTPR